MTADHKLGKEGEKIASDYLRKIDFSIIDQNWHSGKYGEIDIVAYDKSTKDLVFIEVKSRTTSTNDAKELVTQKKQEQLYKLAKSYLYLKGYENASCRFDVIAIKINKGRSGVTPPLLEHIKNAFYLQ